MPFGLHKYMEQECKYFTIIREPVKRLISQYNYISRQKINPNHHLVAEKSMSIQQMTESGLVKGFDNAQCRFLTNRFDVPFNELPEDTLDLALSNLEKYFIFSGLTEKFDLSMLMLSKLLGWKKLPYYRRQNTKKSKEKDYKVTDQDIASLRAQNQLDIQLYETAKQKFEKAVEEMPGVLEDLSEYQRKNSLYQKLTYPLSLFS